MKRLHHGLEVMAFVLVACVLIALMIAQRTDDADRRMINAARVPPSTWPATMPTTLP